MKVLVTGGTGSFGTAFARHVLGKGLAEKVVAYARGEHAHAALREALGHPPELQCLVGDVRDPRRLDDAMHRVDTVIHAAALKRVDEADPHELMRTNYEGTVHVITAALGHRVPRVILLSSDKAVEPVLAYGVSKAAAEHYAVWANRYGHPQTRISVIRYGNVLASQGSVVPLWRRQVAAGEPLTVTDPEATRFWLTLGDAVGLVLSVRDLMRGGEIFVPVLQAASLGDLAAAVAPGRPINAVGLRPGEKRHEALVAADEARRAVVADSGLIVVEPAYGGWPREAWRGPRLGEGFRLTSDEAGRLTVEELRLMLGEGEA